MFHVVSGISKYIQLKLKTVNCFICGPGTSKKLWLILNIQIIIPNNLKCVENSLETQEAEIFSKGNNVINDKSMHTFLQL